MHKYHPFRRNRFGLIPAGTLGSFEFIKCLLLFFTLTINLEAFKAKADTVETAIGTGVKGFSGDGGPANKAELNNPFAVSRGPDGYLYVCDVDNHRIRRVDKNGIITTYAGNGEKGFAGDGGKAIGATLHSPYELAWDRAGDLYFVDIGNHTVRKVDSMTGIISTVAGTGTAGFSGDNGPANQAQLNQPHSLAFDPKGNLFVCDIINHRVRKIDLTSKQITTWSGDGKRMTSPDGTDIGAASLNGPRAIAFAPDGTLWLALREGNSLLRLDTQENKLYRVAGTGKSGFTGNGGPALQATLAGPKCVSLDNDGNVYLADTESHSIRMVNVKSKTIEVLVGNGTKGDGPDGDPLQCKLNRPHGVFVDQDGSVYIGDSENHRVRRLIKQ